MNKLTKIEKIWNEGEKIYDDFASQFGFKYATPHTTTLEKFFLLKEKKANKILLCEMMTEYLSNINYS